MLWVSLIVLSAIGFTMVHEVKIVRSEFHDGFRSVDNKIYKLHSKSRVLSQMRTLPRTKYWTLEIFWTKHGLVNTPDELSHEM